MSLPDFWQNVRRAASLLAAPKVNADSSRVDEASVESQLQGANLWLVCGAVAGFDTADLSFLKQGDRDNLTKLVNSFRSEVSKVNPKGPAPAEVAVDAANLLQEIAECLGFERYEDVEADRLGKQIEKELRADWPEELQELWFRTGLDHTGDPALWVLVVLEDSAAVTDDHFFETVLRVQPRIDKLAREAAPDRFPYLSFRSLAEQRELTKTT